MPAAPRTDWWNTVAASGVQPRNLTTLGALKAINHWAFPWYERKHLLFIRKCLTEDWALIQGGSGEETKRLWALIFKALELDQKACGGIMLLAHSGEAGRAEANEVLWELLSYWGLKPEYEDLSHKASNLVGLHRRNIDRPPWAHQDMRWWRWACYYVPRQPRWGPLAAPRGEDRAPRVNTGTGGQPLEPPDCWAPPADSWSI